jgi:hypothetical protein
MLKQFTGEQVITDFLLGLLTDSGMDAVSPEVKAQMLKDLHARLQDRFIATVLTNLEEDKYEEFANLIESQPSEEAVQRFIDGNVPNAAELFGQAMLKFRNDYLGINQ